MSETRVVNKMEDTLLLTKKLSRESHTGLLFAYKVLKEYGFDYQRAFACLKSEDFKNSFESHERRMQ